MSNGKTKLVFAPGCFDDFEGTQEELDELIAQIQKSFEDGSLFEESTLVDMDLLDDEVMQALEDAQRRYMEGTRNKNLN